MNPDFVSDVCRDIFQKPPDLIHRFSTGLGNYVFLVQVDQVPYVFRCSKESYAQTFYWLDKLQALDLPVSKVLAQGTRENLHYMLATYLEGAELGDLYPALSDREKRTLAKEVVQIQNRVSELPMDGPCDWPAWVDSMLERARTRITANGYFDPQKVERVAAATVQLQDYFRNITPRPYLDDITTKNLLVKGGHVSGIIDVDWMGYGDRLTFAALTNMALLNLQYDTDYVRYLLEEMHLTQEEYRAFLFYTLLYCVDFMGERGTVFTGRTVSVDQDTIANLNRIYDQLWEQYV